MRRSTVIIAIILIFLFASLSGCSTKNGDQTPQAPPEGLNVSNDDKTVYPFTLVDDTGTEITIPAKPQRIVSLLPSSTEILAALGQTPVAVTQWDDYPANIQEKAEYIFEDALNPNLEQLLNLQPDLIMFWLTSQEDTDKIRNLGIPVVVFDDKNISEVYDTIALTGKITDTPEQASQIIEQMKAKEKGIESKIDKLSQEERRKVWIEVDSNLYTAGSGTFLDEIITKAGGVNIARDVNGWGKFNSEQVIARNPDVIFETYSYFDKNAIENILKRKGWENIEAIKNKRVIGLDNNIISRQGPRIVDGLEIAAHAIYPELFDGK
ncbi:MAG: ABC transporter substrate-binding protein [Gracilibacter sp. BRH_c7a]|nr:MAG: ABC transporter substrate-binding protein [Gracilibacter sp. BRH_c7a]KUO65088.1 MAG: ABC transporter substrate-binding protein [Gracilibacter sp. BRH_c7a]